MKNLYRTLTDHKNLNRVSFHTPGHKNVPGSLFADYFSLDFTELPDTDSLYEASGAILKSEQIMSEIFGTKHTFFSAGGCTLCIQAMIRQVSKDKKKIILGRTIHKSAINTIALLGLDPIFVMPRCDAGPFLPGRVHSEDIKKLLSENHDVCAVYVTSPDYFGVMSDIRSIASECEKFDVPLIVDNAHGTHLKFLSEDLHPLSLGASMSADSAHKTLPVLTGGALLQVNSETLLDGVRESMSLFGSTSPSYPIMTSLDLCAEWLAKFGKDAFKQTETQVANLLSISNSYGILSPKGMCDPIRISLSTLSLGISGHDFADLLRNNGIEPEYANKSYVVLIATPMNSENDFNKLKDVLCKLKSRSCNYDFSTCHEEKIFPSIIPKKIISPREAMFSKYETIKLNDAVGRICFETIAPCPPGIPVVMPGELISYEVKELLKEYGVSFIKVLQDFSKV